MAKVNKQTARDPEANYYIAGGIECIDILKAKLTPEQFKGWLLGTKITYDLRMNFKFDDPKLQLRDMEKAALYAKLLVEEMKEKLAG